MFPIRLSRAASAIPALLFLTLLAGVAPQASAQTLPTVTVAAGTSPVTEGGDAVFTLTVTRTANPIPAGVGLRVNIVVSTEGDFSTPTSGWVWFPATGPSAGEYVLTRSTKNDGEHEKDGSVTLTVKDGEGYTVGAVGSASVIVQDDEPPPVVSFESESSEVREDAGTVNLEVVVDPPSAASYALNYTLGGTATSGSDYTALSGTLTVPAGATTATIPVTVIDDSVPEGSETVVLSLSGGSDYQVGSPGAHTLTIATSDPPVVSFASAWRWVGEEVGTHNVEVKLNKAPPADLTLAYTVGGNATAGSDYTALSGTVTVPAGATTATIPVTVIDDSVPEGSEMIILRLAASGGYRLGNTRKNTLLSIADNDTPEVSFASTSQHVDEGAGTSNVTINLSPTPTSPVTLIYTVGGTATAGSDYTALSGKVTVAAGAATATIPVAIMDDGVDESGETVVLKLTGGKDYEVGLPRTHTLIIDPVPTVTFARRWGVIFEVEGTYNVPVHLYPAPASGITVHYTVGGDGSPRTGTATPGLDFTIANSGTLSVPAGAKTATIPVTIIDDSVEDGVEVMRLTLTDRLGYMVGRRYPHFDLYIFNHEPDNLKRLAQDDDEPAPAEPEVTISAGTSPVTEGGDATFTVTANPAPGADLAVTVTVAVEGDFGVTAGERTMTVPATGSATLTLATTGDDADEPDGSVSVTVAAGGGYTVGDPASGTVAIADDDPATVATVDAALVAEVTAKADGHSNPDAAARLRRIVKGMTGEDGGYTAEECRETATRHGVLSTWKPWCDEIARREAHARPKQPLAPLPEISISVGAGVTEGGDAVFTVTASPAPAAELAVTVTVAAEGDFGVTAGSQSVTVPTTGSAVLTLATANDEVDEADGSVSVTVAAGEGYTVGDPASGTVSVQDDDAPLPGITIAAGTSPVTEGGDAAFTVTASPAPAAELTVSVTVAVDGDYGIAAGKQTVTIPTTGSAVLTLATANDEVDEADGSVSVTVAAGNGYTVGDPASGTVAVQDDDVPAITVSAGDAVTEGGDATFTVTANPAPASPLAVSVTVAVRGDYGIASGTQTVSIPATGSAVLTLATSDDAADEPDGSVSVTVAAGEGYTVGDPASGSVSIADDDLPPPAVSIAAKAASVTEGGAAAFTLTADRAPDADLTVTLSVAETGGGDHVAAADEGPATAVIAKGATEAVFSVATVDDDVNEPDGSVTVTLKDGGGYTVPSPPGNAAAVTVSDDDAAVGPVLSVDDATGQENGRLPAMPFTVRLSAPAQDTVRVYVSTRPSTPMSATPKVDYAPASYYLLFRAGETEKQVWVMIHNDSHDEEPETFEVVLSKVQGAPVGDGVAVGTIVNDDPMPAAWLARFGRAVAEQALDGIAARMTADRSPGLQGSIAGQALDFGGNAAGGPDLSQFPGSLSGPGVEAQSRGMTMQEVLRGSSFSLTGEADGSGGTLSFWGGSPGSGGLVSGSQFAGSQRGDGTAVRLDGETGAALLGTDYARGRWLVGFALSQVRAEGGYAGEGAPDCSGLPESVPASACAVAARAGNGEVEASLTATIPYAALAVSERLRLWGAAGQGAGDVTVKTGSGGSYRADTAWSMAAAGLRGDLLAPPAPGPGSGAGSGSGSGTGPALALTSDALWVRTSSEKTGDLAASESDVSRLRVGLEGSWGVALSGGGSVTPKLELGARHDGGDAETGFGVELGGGLAWRDPKLGLTLDLSGRTLVAHDDGGLEDRGVSARLSYDPEPSSGRGLSLSLGQDWGGRAQGGLDALFQPEPLEDRAGSGGGHEATSRWAMEAAWGLPALGGRFTGSPYMGLGLATGARDYSLGWRLAPEAATAPGLSFGLRATRRESDTASPEHVLGIEATARW